MVPSDLAQVPSRRLLPTVRLRRDNTLSFGDSQHERHANHSLRLTSVVYLIAPLWPHVTSGQCVRFAAANEGEATESRDLVCLRTVAL